ncbi:YbhB/YbcL family Raf kinase inhibitor-like protein [Candidatus Dependentiae bacterium]|nr:YbhB/YbcL family Raf kinase inhibitor-like protein [Candidatus Dependentiae bacterium]
MNKITIPKIITITSDAFEDGEMIPKKYTCEGKNISPQLSWNNIPEKTRSLVITCLDPDAPTENPFVHWIIYNIPVTRKTLPENIPNNREILLEKGIKQGTNDFNQIGYKGPCPPVGKIHRYVFTIYALNNPIELDAGERIAALFKAMSNHVLAQGQIEGRFSRKKFIK